MALSTCSESSMLIYLLIGIPRKLTDSCLWIRVITLEPLPLCIFLMRASLMASSRFCLKKGMKMELPSNRIQNSDGKMRMSSICPSDPFHCRIS